MILQERRHGANTLEIIYKSREGTKCPFLGQATAEGKEEKARRIFSLLVISITISLGNTEDSPLWTSVSWVLPQQTIAQLMLGQMSDQQTLPHSSESNGEC